MKVYVAQYSTCWEEGFWVIGVFTTKSLARAACALYHKDSGNPYMGPMCSKHYDIVEFAVDSAYSYGGMIK